MTALINYLLKKVRVTQNRSKPEYPRQYVLIEQEFVTDLCGLKSKSFFGKVIVLRISVGLAREI